MGSYPRVMPRDLFNEASLLKCMGALWIALHERGDHHATIRDEVLDSFDIEQDPASGSITVANVVFEVRGVRHRLVRPLNARAPWPLLMEGSDADPDFEEIYVFDDEGKLTPEMLAFIG